MHNSITFKMKLLNYKNMHYLDLDITRGNKIITIESNTVIPNTSNNPTK